MNLSKGGKRNEKKIISMLLCATMAATMVTGCGDTSGDGDKTP